MTQFKDVEETWVVTYVTYNNFTSKTFQPSKERAFEVFNDLLRLPHVTAVALPYKEE